MPRRIVHHGPPGGADLPGDGSGEVGLSKPWVSKQKQVSGAAAELVGKLRAAVVDHLHMASRGLAVSRLHPVGVPVQGEGVKALAPQVQHPAELLLLLLGVVPLQTAADPALAVSRVFLSPERCKRTAR